MFGHHASPKYKKCLWKVRLAQGVKQREKVTKEGVGGTITLAKEQIGGMREERRGRGGVEVTEPGEF